MNERGSLKNIKEHSNIEHSNIGEHLNIWISDHSNVSDHIGINEIWNIRTLSNNQTFCMLSIWYGLYYIVPCISLIVENSIIRILKPKNVFHIELMKLAVCQLRSAPTIPRKCHAWSFYMIWIIKKDLFGI